MPLDKAVEQGADLGLLPGEELELVEDDHRLALFQFGESGESGSPTPQRLLGIDPAASELLPTRRRP